VDLYVQCLDEGVRLTPAQACHVGMAVCAALEYSHSRSIVHRDIKPANLLFDEHGIVRVADFGLARALAEASFTEPSGAVIGTARYASPEQASGVALDGRSDLYSLALVLHEAVTGEVPFAGDTVTSTLAARIKNDVFADKKLGVLGSVVERAGHANPDERYPDAKTMFKALTDISQVLPKPGPLTLVPEDGLVIDPNPTNIVVTPTNLYDQESGEIDLRDDMSPEQVSARFHQQNKLDKRFGRKQYVGAAILSLVLAVLIAGVFTFLTSNQSTVVVPNVAGLQKDVASAKIATTGLRVKFVEVYADDPVGSVLKTSPGSGAYADSNASVTLTLSKGPKPIDAVDVMKEKLNPLDAKTALEAKGFIVVERREFNEEIAKDSLIATDPATNKKLPPESTITLIISDGPTPVGIPNVAGKTFDEASAVLSAVPFAVARRDIFLIALQQVLLLVLNLVVAAKHKRTAPLLLLFLKVQILLLFLH
jgi:serine/threonine protein kinase